MINLLENVIRDKPLDWQQELFVDIFGHEYPVIKYYQNLCKIDGTTKEKKRVWKRNEFISIEEIMFRNIH